MEQFPRSDAPVGTPPFRKIWFCSGTRLHKNCPWNIHRGNTACYAYFFFFFFFTTGPDSAFDFPARLPRNISLLYFHIVLGDPWTAFAEKNDQVGFQRFSERMFLSLCDFFFFFDKMFLLYTVRRVYKRIIRCHRRISCLVPNEKFVSMRQDDSHGTHSTFSMQSQRVQFS